MNVRKVVAVIDTDTDSLGRRRGRQKFRHDKMGEEEAIPL
jgi:hypothetical protein